LKSAVRDDRFFDFAIMEDRIDKPYPSAELTDQLPALKPRCAMLNAGVARWQFGKEETMKNGDRGVQ
jgi:hypothetical protein